MVDYVDLNSVMSISNRLDRFKIVSRAPFRANFRCPECGDSKKSKSKARGWLLEKGQSMHFYCHNCGSSQTLPKFLKSIDQLVYNAYISDKYLNGARKPEEKVEKEHKFEQPKFKKSVLNSIKKISQLKHDHPVKKYIQQRQIPTNQHYRLYYAPKFKSWINSIIPNKFPDVKKDEPRLILPFFDKQGNVFGVSARGFDPNGLRYITIMFSEVPKIFGLDKVDFNKKYYIVEGAIDSLFLENSIAMAGADGNTSGLENLDKAVFIFDAEPRNREIHKRMEKIIRAGHSICIWPDNLPGKDINEMFLAGETNIKEIVDENTYNGLEANLKMMSWKKT